MEIVACYWLLAMNVIFFYMIRYCYEHTSIYISVTILTRINQQMNKHSDFIVSIVNMPFNWNNPINYCYMI